MPAQFNRLLLLTITVTITLPRYFSRIKPSHLPSFLQFVDVPVISTGNDEMTRDIRTGILGVSTETESVRFLSRLDELINMYGAGDTGKTI